MSRLSRDNILDIDDRVTVLEGEEPKVHSGTIHKIELEKLDDRITILEGEEPVVHNNEMRLSDISDFEERVEALEEDEPIKEYEVDFVKIFNDTYKDDDPVQFITNTKLKEVGTQAFLESVNPAYYAISYMYVSESLDKSKAHSFIIEAEDGNHLTGDYSIPEEAPTDSATITLRTKKDGTFLVVVTMNGETGEYEASVTPAN